MKKVQEKFNRKIRDFCDSQYKLINVEPGELNFYYKCHLTSTHYAIKNGDKKLALVMYRDKKSMRPCVHFVNYTNKKFVDNSLGNWSSQYEYRFIRWVAKEEFFDVDNILGDTQKFFKNKANLIEKLFAYTGV